jgi:hypothetical protein
MARNGIVNVARHWRPADDDPHGADKRALLDYLLQHARGLENAVPIRRVAAEAEFTRPYSVKSVQQQLMVPLRRQGEVFVGMCNHGIFLPESAQDFSEIISFYDTRIRSEQRHKANVMRLARRYGLLDHPRH